MEHAAHGTFAAVAETLTIAKGGREVAPP